VVERPVDPSFHLMGAFAKNLSFRAVDDDLQSTPSPPYECPDTNSNGDGPD